MLWHKVDPAKLASRLKLIINQRLVRRLCEACRKPSQVTDRVLKMMGLTPDEALDLKVHQGNGCDTCGALSPGYAGRVPLCEVLEATPEIATLVAAGGSPGEIEREARRAGMSPLRAACLARVGQGVTSLEEFQKGNF
jgi:type IV pilus assembly protein PilB